MRTQCDMTVYSLSFSGKSTTNHTRAGEKHLLLYGCKPFWSTQATPPISDVTAGDF